ncbi:MAG: hypothetical protein K5900_09020 [Butyrivibrio sp.]|nr:hypothetical protein [Butyrivibrio sp.]
MAFIRSAVMSKKIFWLIIIAVFIIITLLICVRISNLDNTNKKEQDSYSGIVIENTDEITAVLRQTLEHRTNSVKITFEAYTLDDTAIEKVVDDLVQDAFYESDDPKGGDYLRYQYGGYELRHSSTINGDKYIYNVRLTPVCYTTIEQEEKVDEMVTELLNTADVTTNSSDYEKAKWVHDYICDTVTYDTVHKHQPGSSHIQSTAYGALYYHTALCQGYAVLAYRLLKELGADVRIITGDSNVSGETEKHAWNLVSIDGLYYNMDVTLDDQDGNTDFFLKTDDYFKDTHIRDAEFMSDEFYQEYPMSEENY